MSLFQILVPGLCLVRRGGSKDEPTGKKEAASFLEVDWESAIANLRDLLQVWET